MVKTAEQMNQERRAAKQRQQAAAKARKVNSVRFQEFDLQAAVSDSRKKQQTEAAKSRQRQNEIQDAYDKIRQHGSIQIEMNRWKRDVWIAWCFDLIKIIRSRSHEVKIDYNSNWKEVRIFSAEIVRN